jgi:Icc protein
MDFSVQSATSENSVRLIQITDSHLGVRGSESLLGLNTDQSLDDVLQLINREQPEFDAIICTGDIASAGGDSCYYRFVDAVRDYFDAPLGWLPGNHDSAEVMASINMYDPPETRQMRLGNWLIVLLDSSVPGEVYGYLTRSELDFLAQTLSANPELHTLVMLHHQPIPIGSAWIDQYILRNADEFFAVTDRYPQIRAVSWGHVHQDFSAERKGQLMLATPSTCVQFKPRCDEFTVDTAMPGYRWFELHDDGRCETGISRVTDKQYTIDYQSAGY